VIAPVQPTTPSSSFLGRGSQGWAAWDVQNKQLLWVKKASVAAGPSMITEGEYYECLDGKVENIMSVMAHGWTGDEDQPVYRWQRSIVLLHGHEGWNWGEEARQSCLKLLPLRQYIILLDRVGRPLADLRSSKSLVHVLFGAAKGSSLSSLSLEPLTLHYIGLIDANDAGVVHRDVSSENVLWKGPEDAPQGFITDWETARNYKWTKCLGDPASAPRQAFMEVSLTPRGV
jgi:hypothetical protein